MHRYQRVYLRMLRPCSILSLHKVYIIPYFQFPSIIRRKNSRLLLRLLMPFRCKNLENIILYILPLTTLPIKHLGLMT